MSRRKIDYSLPDSILLNSPVTRIMVWQPEFPVIVVGQSNSPENYVLVEKALLDGIAVMKRPSGGETVVLTPRMFVVSLILKGNKLPKSSDFFSSINNFLIKGLNKAGLENVKYRGISDLAVENKKIMGSSIYRKPGMLFYHAVFNFGESPDYIASYLKHPVREPDYRKGRLHSDFVTTLEAVGIKETLSNTMIIIESNLIPILTNLRE
jgi:lipoate---protein ligase